MKKKEIIIEEQIPSWVICYFVNGDATGLEDGEIKMADKWLKDNKVVSVCPKHTVLPDGSCGDICEPYFSHCPAFGLPADVYDCDVICETD